MSSSTGLYSLNDFSDKLIEHVVLLFLAIGVVTISVVAYYLCKFFSDAFKR